MPDIAPDNPFSVVQSILSEIGQEWNKAEHCMKLSEQIVQKPVAASINELRYAGRRIIDALERLKIDPSDAKIRPLLEDALFNCHCAQHDAVDVALDAMAIDFETMEKRLGYPAILAAYPNFADLLGELDPAREKIARSRQDRTNREAIYDSVTDVDLPSIAKLYRTLKASKPIMLAFVAKHNRQRIAWWAMAFLTLASVVFGGFQWLDARDARSQIVEPKQEVPASAANR